MTQRESDDPAARPRPRPASGDEAGTVDQPDGRAPGRSTPDRRVPGRRRGRQRRPGRQLALPEPVATGQVVAAAGNAVVTAARVGRLLGRTGWRIAKQIPAVAAVEEQATRLGQAAAGELARMLDLPQHVLGGSSAEERRVMMLVQDAATDPEPLRTAMTELLERSTGTDVGQGRDYLFGTIVSQLVPDEARILAALSSGRLFAAVDVVVKQVGRSHTRVILANASTVGTAAEVAMPHSVPTYLTRLAGFGLLDFGQPIDSLDSQFAALADDPLVREARAEADSGKLGTSRVVRKSVTLSRLGRDFWAACAPSRDALERRSS